MVHTSYNASQVALSIAIAIFASYTALDLGGRVRDETGARRWAWLSGAALAMGGGIWSMHFIGMLAFEMPMPVSYEAGLTALSFLFAVGATGAAFAAVTRNGASARDIPVSGLLMGLGVAAMHYTGMAAMRMNSEVAYDPALAALSIVIAVTAATAALWLTFRRNDVGQKLAAAVVMGLAVSGMHYTGMAAARFIEPAQPMQHHPVLFAFEQQNLSLTVAGATLLILFLGMLASSIDQQRTRRELMASEQRFRAAAEAVGDIIWTNDAEGQMRGPQPDWQRFTGQKQEDYQGYGWSDAIHPDDVQPTLDAWNAAVAARRLAAFEHRVRRHDGVYRMFSVRAVPVLTPGGTIREWVGVHEDITEQRDFEIALKQARDAAEEANLAKSTFIANMSHELRTPLSAIIGYSEMLLEEAEESGDSAGLGSDLRKIEGNARHLLGLINDVLDLSKVESGKMEIYSEDFAIAPTIEELATAVQSLIAKKNNRLDVKLAPDLGIMHSDLTKVRQMLFNLLSNAAKFTEGGIITLDVAREADTVLFKVSDTGIGMSEEQLAKLFQRFQQADASTTRKFGGTGLGLSLTKAFATMLGGSVSVESAPGAGTTFTIRVPAELSRDAAMTAEEKANEPNADLVLVIDDDEDQRTLMTRFLQREGFAVRTARDGATGLAMARDLRPRAILLDVLMPGVDGWSVLSALKADADLAAIPVVMVTFTDQRTLAASLGAADYVMKPVQWERFKAVMDRYRPPETNVLVIDDDADARNRIRTALVRDGWTVAEASDGREGLQRLDEARPGLVLLDLVMPVMDGFEFLDRMRQRPDCDAIPVVVLTSLDLTREDRKRLTGANQVLHKGDVTLRSLTERLQSLTAAART